MLFNKQPKILGVKNYKHLFLGTPTLGKVPTSEFVREKREDGRIMQCLLKLLRSGVKKFSFTLNINEVENHVLVFIPFVYF